METENHDCRTIPLSINQEMTNDILLTGNMKSNTRAILENVCNDFENINVIAPKDNYVYKKWKLPSNFSEFSNDGSDITGVDVTSSLEYSSAVETFTSSAASIENESLKNNVLNENTLHSHLSTAIVVPSVDSENQNCEVVNSDKNARTEMLPFRDPTKVGILSEDFANDKNLSSSLAELADAEIVQTSENSVSIIISNPRFIQVVTSKSSDIPSDTSNLSLDNNTPTTILEKEHVANLSEVIEVESVAKVSEYSLQQEINADVDDENNFEDKKETKKNHSSADKCNFTTSTPFSREKRSYLKSARTDLGKVSKARRITAKMKNEWARELESKGVLICPMVGCFQKYRTLANFQTHVKHCCSGMEKDLKHCPYCDSFIISSRKAVLHHMQVEHPEKLEEYKISFPAPAAGLYENVEVSDERDDSRLSLELSAKSTKNYKRRKFLYKENRLSEKKRILKHKQIKSMNESDIVNTKLKECGRFDEIVSRISSVSKTHMTAVDEKVTTERKKRRLVLTGKVVAAEKYFEDEREREDVEDVYELNKEPNLDEKMHTKSRLVLNLDRYKRYSEYLKVTRDWSSHRKTYSRPKNSDNVLDSSQVLTLQNDSSELDIHQLSLNSSLESSRAGNETFCLSKSEEVLPTEISTLDFPFSETEIGFLDETNNECGNIRNSGIFNEKDSRPITKNDILTETVSIKERHCVYDNAAKKSKEITLPSKNMKIEIVPRKANIKMSPIITYGKIADTIAIKSDEKRPAPVDFDSLKKIKNTVCVNKTKKGMSSEQPKHNKEDGIKHPNREPEYCVNTQRKRGRPRKDSSIKIVKPKKTASKQKMITDNVSLKRLKKSIGNVTKRKKESSMRIRNEKYKRKIAKKKSNMSLKCQSLSARSSLKKAMYRVRKGKSRICVKSLFRKNVYVQEAHIKDKIQQHEDDSPAKISDVDDHNYFSTVKNKVKLDKEKLSEYQQNVENENAVIYGSLKEADCTEVFQEVIIDSTSLEIPLPPSPQVKEIIHLKPTEDQLTEKVSVSSHENMPEICDVSSKNDICDTSDSGSNPLVLDKSITCPSSPILIKRARGRPRKNKTEQLKQVKLQNVSPNVMVASNVVGVRKSERVKKRKLDISTEDKIEESPTPHTVKPSPQTLTHEKPEKTGRRGRPRKYPKLEENVCEKPVSPLPADSSNDLENVNNLRKYSRKGRPRKFFKESKEVLDNKVSEKIVPAIEIAKEKNISSEIEPPKAVLSSTVSCGCLTTNDNYKGLILPLKKRKQVGDEESSNTKTYICEKVLFEERPEPPPTNETSGGKNSTVDIDDSSKVKASNAVKACCIEKDSVLPDFENLTHALCDSQHTSESLLSSLRPDINKFKLCLSNVFEEHLQSSIRVKIDDSADWMTLKCFDSISTPKKNGSDIATFFVGGPVYSSAFCPTPSNVDQYIAVASSDSLHNSEPYSMSAGISSPRGNENAGLIQIWNLGCLHKSTTLSQPPSMELAIFHAKHGLVTEMKWCPRGCYDDPSKTNGLPRLGVLALAFSDSNVRIFSVPNPKLMHTQNKKIEKFPIYSTSPALTLAPLFSDPCSATRKSIATCVEWQKNGQQVAAGYGNGSICIWNVTKTSPTIKMQSETEILTVQPYLIFQAGGTPVTSISFSPLNSSRFIVCSSFDKTLKFFDLLDTCMPFCSVKRGFARTCEFTNDFCGAFVSLHDGVTFKGSTFAKECGTEEFAPYNISGSVVSLTNSAFSTIISAHAISDWNGTVSVNFVHCIYDESKQPSYDAHIIYKTEVVTLDDGRNLPEILTPTPDLEIAEVVSDMEHIIDVVNQAVGHCEKSDTFASKSTVDIIENSKPHCIDPIISDLVNNMVESVALDVLIPMHDGDLCVIKSKENSKEESNDAMVKLDIPPCAAFVSNGVKEDEEFEKANILSDMATSGSEDLMHHTLQVKTPNESDSPSEEIMCPSKNVDSIFCESLSESPIKDTSAVGCISSPVGNSFDEQSVGSECCVLEFESDSDFSDISNHQEVSNFSDDSMLSECSYLSDSSESIFSESLVSDIPYESSSQHPQVILKIIDPITSSPRKNKRSISEFRSTPSENCSNQLPCEESIATIKENFVGAEHSQSKVLNSSPHVQDESFNVSSIINDEIRNLNESNSSSLHTTQTLDINSVSSKQNSESNDGLTGKESENISVPELSTCVSDHLDMCNGENFLTDDSSLSIKNNKSNSEFDSTSDPKEPSHFDGQLQFPRTCKPFNENSDSMCIERNTKENPSYTALAATSGLIFKDVLSLGDTTDEKDILPVENNPLSAINTISWNPNLHCHYWLFTAGNSGVARLACVSELNGQENTSL